jgi:hypothetical protein
MVQHAPATGRVKMSPDGVCVAFTAVLLQAVKVNSFGKWKTALQMTSMSLLLFCKDGTGRVHDMFAGGMRTLDS